MRETPPRGDLSTLNKERGSTNNKSRKHSRKHIRNQRAQISKGGSKWATQSFSKKKFISSGFITRSRKLKVSVRSLTLSIGVEVEESVLLSEGEEQEDRSEWKFRKEG